MPALVMLALFHAFQAAGSLLLAHLLGVGFIMYMDLSGRWTPYALCRNRPAKTVSHYLPGLQSLIGDLVWLFIPCLTVCCWCQSDAILFGKVPTDGNDLLQAAVKSLSGYVLGKVWAFGIHYLLHHPRFYRYHKKHHQKPADLVASAAWEDSMVEYAIMELPSFCLTLFVFPTYWALHLVHFAAHGLDGACGHSGFKAPGIMGTYIHTWHAWSCNKIQGQQQLSNQTLTPFLLSRRLRV
jgi:hypothetical protein